MAPRHHNTGEPEEVQHDFEGPMREPTTRGTALIFSLITLVVSILTTTVLVSTQAGRLDQRVAIMQQEVAGLLDRERSYRPYNAFVSRDEWTATSAELFRRLDAIERKVDRIH